VLASPARLVRQLEIDFGQTVLVASPARLRVRQQKNAPWPLAQLASPAHCVRQLNTSPLTVEIQGFTRTLARAAT